MFRVILAGLLGGALVFFGGFFSHAILNLEGRTIQRVPDEAVFRHVTKDLAPGIYGFPFPVEGYDKLSKDQQDKEDTRVNDHFKKGPAAFVIIAPTGEDMLGPQQLGAEFISNVLCALIAAWILVSTAPATPYASRWFLVLLLGAFTWLSTSASFAIFYRFPVPFIMDGLYASLIEWGFAGLLIAAIARPPLAANNGKHESRSGFPA